MSFKKAAPYLLPIVVLGVLATYILSSTTGRSLGLGFSFLWLLALGVLGVVGSLELGRRLDPRYETLRARAGTVFGVCAFAIFVVVMVVQFGARMLWREHLVGDLAAGLPDQEAMLELAFQGVNTVQATMDVAFDIFYCLAVILFSSLMIRHEAFGRVIGSFGLLAAGGLLLLNLLTFPLPPANAGLYDLGPLTGIWWVAVIVLWVRADRGQGVKSWHETSGSHAKT
jgi:hypothetical protein